MKTIKAIKVLPLYGLVYYCCNPIGTPLSSFLPTISLLFSSCIFYKTFIRDIAFQLPFSTASAKAKNPLSFPLWSPTSQAKKYTSDCLKIIEKTYIIIKIKLFEVLC